VCLWAVRPCNWFRKETIYLAANMITYKTLYVTTHKTTIDISTPSKT
jgi:hypothetical protein